MGGSVMKIFAIMFLLFLPTAVLAQNYQNMSEQDMQKMMQQARKMQECMMNIDQEKLREIEQRSIQLDIELKNLCAKGKRDAAQAKAISFGMEMAEDPTLLEMRKCGEMYQGMVPNMPYMEQYQVEDEDRASHHVCD
jgi:hypothetical protein